MDPGVEWREKNTTYATLDWSIPLVQTSIVLVDVWQRHHLIDTEERGEKIIQEKLVPLLDLCRNSRMKIIHALSPSVAQTHAQWVRLVSAEEMKPGGTSEGLYHYRKIDSHAHVYFTEDSPETQIDFADRLGIEKLVISRPMAPGSEGTPEEFRTCNDLILNSIKKFPDRFIGQATLNPTYQKESLEEIDRCVDQGMVGLKLYNHVKLSDPLFYPVFERLIDLKMIILMHMGIGKSRIEYDPREPANVSTPEDFVIAANKFPEAMFQLAHLGGGGDWLDACKAVKDLPNVFVDVCGSNNEADIIGFALELLGEDRIFFGCDNSFYQGVGHMIAADLTEIQRKKIFFDNYNQILRKAGRHVD